MKNLKFVTLIFFICLLFIGCSHKSQENSPESKPELVDFVYQQLLFKKYNITDFKNPQIFYTPDFIYNLLIRPYITKDGEISNFERINPEYITKLDTTFIYDPSSDNGNWVDEVIKQAENEGLFSEILPDDFIFDFDDDFLNQAEEIRLFDSLDELKIMKYGSEVFIPQKIGDNLVFINANKGKISRNVFDNEFKLIKKEVWKENQGDLKRVLVENYEYIPSTVKVASKTITTDSKEEKTTYNEMGLVTGNEIYSIRNVNGNIKKSFVESSSWSYDSQKRITKESFSEIINGKRETSETRYKYKKENQTPDKDYYENGVLKIKTIYTTNTDYENIIFFEDEMSVHTFYEKNKKIKDVYYIGDIILRETIYE